MGLAFVAETILEMERDDGMVVVVLVKVFMLEASEIVARWALVAKSFIIVIFVCCLVVGSLVVSSFRDHDSRLIDTTIDDVHGSSPLAKLFTDLLS